MVRRRCTHKDMRLIIFKALDTGARYKITKDGIIFYGEDKTSTAATHFTNSDHRAVKNMIRQLSRIGIIIPT